MLGVLNACAEHDAGLSVAILGVVRDRVAGDGRLVHACREFGAVVITRNHVQSGKVNGLRGVVNRPGKEALVNKVGHLWPTDQVVEHLAEALAVKALRSGGDTEHASVRPLRQDARPCSCGGVMGFVNHDKVRSHDAVEPTDQSLDAGDLRQLMALRSKAGSNEAMRHVHGVERAVTLLQEFLTVDEH